MAKRSRRAVSGNRCGEAEELRPAVVTSEVLDPIARNPVRFLAALAAGYQVQHRRIVKIEEIK
jgi:hypothetical protein